MKRSFLIFLIIAFFSSIATLFQVKLRFREIDNEVKRIRVDLSVVNSEIYLLQAEWSYLNRPDRLFRLAKRHLMNDVILTNQVREDMGSLHRKISVVANNRISK